MANKTLGSDGNKYTQAQIDKNRSRAYQEKYGPYPQQCEGCGGVPQGSAHWIPQARLKQLGLTDKIWHPDFFGAACHACNSSAEAIYSEEFKKLRNYDYIMKLMETYDPERYSKISE